MDTVCVIKAVEDLNNFQKQVLFTKFLKYFKGSVAGRIIGLWGLALSHLLMI